MTEPDRRPDHDPTPVRVETASPETTVELSILDVLDHLAEGAGRRASTEKLAADQSERVDNIARLARQLKEELDELWHLGENPRA